MPSQPMQSPPTLELDDIALSLSAVPTLTGAQVVGIVPSPMTPIGLVTDEREARFVVGPLTDSELCGYDARLSYAVLTTPSYPTLSYLPAYVLPAYDSRVYHNGS